MCKANWRKIYMYKYIFQFHPTHQLVPTPYNFESYSHNDIYSGTSYCKSRWSETPMRIPLKYKSFFYLTENPKGNLKLLISIESAYVCERGTRDCVVILLWCFVLKIRFFFLYKTIRGDNNNTEEYLYIYSNLHMVK